MLRIKAFPGVPEPIETALSATLKSRLDWNIGWDGKGKSSGLAACYGKNFFSDAVGAVDFLLQPDFSRKPAVSRYIIPEAVFPNTEKGLFYHLGWLLISLRAASCK